MGFTDGRAGVAGVKRRFFSARLLTLVAVIACAALAAPGVASAKKKTHTVDATMTLAIIGQPEGSYEFAARLTGKPFGTAAAIGDQPTSTPTGLITEGRPVVYAKKGTINLKTRDVVEFQPDGSITSTGPSRSSAAAAIQGRHGRRHVQRHASTREHPDGGPRGHLRRGRQGSVPAGGRYRRARRVGRPKGPSPRRSHPLPSAAARSSNSSRDTPVSTQ